MSVYSSGLVKVACEFVETGDPDFDRVIFTNYVAIAFNDGSDFDRVKRALWETYMCDIGMYDSDRIIIHSLKTVKYDVIIGDDN
jgi:hypothetical protein